MKKLHFALIGAGKHGTRWINVIQKYAVLDEIVDPKLEDNETFEGVCRDKNIDAVLIATPHEFLSSITFRAFEADKHVLCEKPGAISSVQIKKNIELAKEKGLTYMIGYNYRFHDAFIKARKLFDKGTIGKLLFIRATHGFGGRKGYEKEWRISTGGGHLRDQGVHMIDMAKSFMGKIDKVQGMRADTYWGSGTEDNAFVLLKSGKVIVSIHSSLTQWKRKHTFEIYGTKGYLVVDGLGKRYGVDEHLILGKRTKNPDTVKEEWIDCNTNADDSLVLELKEFISAIREVRSTTPSPVDAYETLKIVEEIYKTNKL